MLYMVKKYVYTFYYVYSYMLHIQIHIYTFLASVIYVDNLKVTVLNSGEQINLNEPPYNSMHEIVFSSCNKFS